MRPDTALEERLVLAPEDRLQAVAEVIRSARRKLLLSLFRCTDFRVLVELARAVDRGVRVEALLTPRARGWQKKLKDLSALLESMGVIVHPYQGPAQKYHAKYIVADDGPALVASMNFTRKCFSDTCDFLLVSWDGEVVTGLQSLFAADCRPGPTSFSGCLTGRLVVGPERARASLTGLLLAARRSIRIIDHRVSDPNIVALLESRKADGVAVEVLGRGALGGLLSHGKMILIDGVKAVIGSIALSAASLDRRRELGVVVEDRGWAGKLDEFFRCLSGAHPQPRWEVST